jgi:hypothetical protein
MMLSRLEGVVERRLLVNYRADPEVVARLLPAPFRPQLVGEFAVIGICMLRLGQLRPPGTPRILGLRSESAAHRIAVEWDTADGTSNGVYVPRRDTASVVNAAAGGRIFPGQQRRARFRVVESDDRLEVAFVSVDGAVSVAVTATQAREFQSRLFGDLQAASQFFEHGAIGHSPAGRPSTFDSVELQSDSWRMRPAQVVSATSSFFDDRDRFPPGSVSLDSALLMRDVPVAWKRIDRHETGTGARRAGVPTSC